MGRVAYMRIRDAASGHREFTNVSTVIRFGLYPLMPYADGGTGQTETQGGTEKQNYSGNVLRISAHETVYRNDLTENGTRQKLQPKPKSVALMNVLVPNISIPRL